MKIFKYGLPLAALAMLASCSNDNVADQPSAPVEEGEAYLAVNISMPSSLAGRAETDNLKDGVAEEYAVTDGTILIFQKDGSETIPEDGYKFVCSGSIDPLTWSAANGDGNQITTSSKTAVATITAANSGKLNLTSSEDIYYVLVVLNKNSLTLPTDGQTFGEWKKNAQSETADEKKGTLDVGLTMTNAPQYVQLTEGSSNDAAPQIHTLVYLDKSKISKVANANLASAATVYVQRIAAKVELKAGSGKNFNAFDVELPAGTEGPADQVVFSHWGLTYYNTTTYPVQVIDDYSSWLTDGGTQTDRYLSGQTFKRVYWGLDPNYKASDAKTAIVQGDATTDLYTQGEGTQTELPHITYCLENTMEFNQMAKIQTTGVLLKGVYNLGGEDKNISFVASKTWRSKIPSGLSLKQEETGASDVFLSELFNEGKDAVLAAFGLTEDIKVNFYAKGVVYYAAQIRHFNNDETPKPETMEDLSSYTPVQRGRFGVLRNNWYEVNITKINGLGDPTIPTPDPNDPDDPKDELYMTVSINILSWYKRSSNYEL